MVLLGKMHPRMLKEKLKHKDNYCTHECNHCGKLIKIAWKVRGYLKNTGSGGTRSYHAVSAIRHLENHCNEAGLHSIESLLNEKSAKRMKHEDEVSAKAETCQEEQGVTSATTKCERGVQQKIASKLSYKYRHFSSQAHFFIHSPSYQTFRTFRDESLVANDEHCYWGNEFASLKIPHLNAYLNSEHRAFKKMVKQEVLDHYEEANQNCFCQFVHDGTTLMNKEKYQAFAMQFADNKFQHNNAIEFYFRTPSSHKADKVAKTVEEVCHEWFDLKIY